MKRNGYHVTLRSLALTLAVVLLFDSGILLPVTEEISDNTQLYLANAVGMYAAVPENEINVFSAQIAEQQRELEARESAIKEREIEVGLSSGESPQNVSTYILSLLLFVIIVLLVLNYVLDFARDRRLIRNTAA